MNPNTWLSRLFRRPLTIRLHDTPDRAAASLHGLAHFINRRDDLDGRRIRIELAIRTKPHPGGRP
jgi:hypothetical protein